MKFDSNSMISENKVMSDYMKGIDFQKVWRIIKRTYKKPDRKRTRGAFISIANSKPKELTRPIVVEFCPPDSLNDSNHCSVYFHAEPEESDTNSFSTLTFYWEEFCSAPIIYSKKFSVYEMIAHFIYEITWYGYKASVRNKRVDRFNEEDEIEDNDYTVLKEGTPTLLVRTALLPKMKNMGLL